MSILLSDNAYDCLIEKKYFLLIKVGYKSKLSLHILLLAMHLKNK